jgi:hypothetical protein
MSAIPRIKNKWILVLLGINTSHNNGGVLAVNWRAMTQMYSRRVRTCEISFRFKGWLI